MASQRALAAAVLERHGRTYCSEAGFTLKDQPSPLYRLCVLSLLLSARIDATIAVAAAHELFRAGYRTPQRMSAATWQQRVDALGRGHYRRYDERTATMLGEGAHLIQNEWNADLRRLPRAPDELRASVQRIPGIGPTGANIFGREAQAVWPELRPFLDDRALAGADAIGLPADPKRLSRLVSAEDLAAFAAGLVRLSLDKEAVRDLHEDVK